MNEGGSPTAAFRASVPPAGARPRPTAQAVRGRALALGLQGWVRGDAGLEDPLSVHAEGDREALAQLAAFLGGDGPAATERAKVEGHEQFAIRGVSAGAFVVQEHQATAHHYDLRLEVEGMMRSWAVPKGPSLDPAAKRLAVQVADHAPSHNDFEGPTDRGGVIVWDRGTYEQGGRVPWPEALQRGHAVFVLHGEKLRGGFALQRTGRGEPGEPSRRSPSGRSQAAGGLERTRSAGQVGDREPQASYSDLELQRPRSQWLLIKRRDDEARAGGAESEITAQRPESVLSGRTLAELLP